MRGFGIRNVITAGAQEWHAHFAVLIALKYQRAVRTAGFMKDTMDIRKLGFDAMKIIINQLISIHRIPFKKWLEEQIVVFKGKNVTVLG